MPDAKPTRYKIDDEALRSKSGSFALRDATFNGDEVNIQVRVQKKDKSKLESFMVNYGYTQAAIVEPFFEDPDEKIRLIISKMYNYDFHLEGEEVVFNLGIRDFYSEKEALRLQTKGLAYFLKDLEEAGIKPQSVDHEKIEMRFTKEEALKAFLDAIRRQEQRGGSNVHISKSCRPGILCSTMYYVTEDGKRKPSFTNFEGESDQLLALLKEKGALPKGEEAPFDFQEGQLVSVQGEYFDKTENAILGKKVDGLPYYAVINPKTSHYGRVEKRFIEMEKYTLAEAKELFGEKIMGGEKLSQNKTLSIGKNTKIQIVEGFESEISTPSGKVLIVSGEINFESYGVGFNFKPKVISVASLADVAQSGGRLPPSFKIGKSSLKGYKSAAISEDGYQEVTKILFYDEQSKSYFMIDLEKTEKMHREKRYGSDVTFKAGTRSAGSEQIIVSTQHSAVSVQYDFRYVRSDLIGAPAGLSSKISKAELPSELNLEQFLKGEHLAKVLTPILGSDNVALVSEKGSRKVYKLTFSSGFEREIEIIVDTGVPKNKVEQVLSHWPDNPNFYDLTKRIEFKTGRPDFKNEATGMILKTAGTASIGPRGSEEKGVLRMYELGFEDTFQHELGHFLAYKLFKSANPPATETVMALKSDGVSPTNYANTNPKEGWAEAVEEYLKNDGGLAPGKEWVRERYSNYFKLIDEAIGVDPKTPDALLKLRNGMSAMGILIIGVPGAVSGIYYLELSAEQRQGS